MNSPMGSRRTPSTLANSTTASSGGEHRKAVTGRRARDDVAADRRRIADLRRTDRARRLGQRRDDAGERGRQRARHRSRRRRGAGCRCPVEGPRTQLRNAVDAHDEIVTPTIGRCPSLTSTIRSVPPATTSASGTRPARRRPPPSWSGSPRTLDELYKPPAASLRVRSRPRPRCPAPVRGTAGRAARACGGGCGRR